MDVLEIKNLRVEVEDKTILDGVNLTIKRGEVHAIMGPNGTGKSTLAMALMHNPQYKISGEVLLNGENLLELSTDEIAKRGVFLSFQSPYEVEGVNIINFLRLAYKNRFDRNIEIREFVKLLDEYRDILKIDKSLLNRYLNVGFSGGEKKRIEMLQMLVLEPKFAIIDEVDSGLDIDALKHVSKAILFAKEKTNLGILIITHYPRILNYVKPDFVHILYKGKIARSGDYSLSLLLEQKGYDAVLNGG